MSRRAGSPVSEGERVTGDEGPMLRAGGAGLPGAAAARGGRVAEAWQMLSGLLQAASLMPATLGAPDASVPLTILGGFLGAGKTTLLNRLLAEPGGRRIAVLVNDFGRINIDASLVRSRTEDMISLANGCACCTVAGDLTRTLIELVQRPEPPEAVVLEASGLADPRGIAQVALTNPSLRLDGVLTLVDAVSFAEARRSVELAGTIHGQLDAADLVVLTKTDEASPVQADAARTALREHYPARPVVEAVHGDLPADLVLGVRSTRDPRREPPVPWDHAAGFQSCALRSDLPLDRARLESFLASVRPRLLRAKGVLRFAGEPGRRHVYQQVGLRSTLDPGEPDDDERATASSLVLIGLAGSVDASALRRAFASLAAA